MRGFQFALLAILAVTLCFAPSASFADEPSGEWKPLMDGKTLDGWHPVGHGKWTVEDGAFVGRANSGLSVSGPVIFTPCLTMWTMSAMIRNANVPISSHLRISGAIPSRLS